MNQVATPIDWDPVHAEVKFLPPNYARVPSLADLEELCLVAGDPFLAGVRAYKENYFRPYYTVSRVAFSEDRTLALLKYTRHCAPLSGGGEFFLALRLEDDQWRIVGGRTLWIS